MMWLTLEDIKAQCRIDGNYEDSLLTLFGNAVEKAILRLCNRTYESVIAEYGEIPSDLNVASLMLAKHLYEHRGVVESVNQSDVPYSFDFFVKPFMILGRKEDGE